MLRYVAVCCGVFSFGLYMPKSFCVKVRVSVPQGLGYIEFTNPLKQSVDKGIDEEDKQKKEKQK